MPPALDSTVEPDRVRLAVDWALSHGLVLMTDDLRAVHAPFALSPAPISLPDLEGMSALTGLVGRAYLRAAADLPFLLEALGESLAADAYTAMVARLARPEQGGRKSQTLRLQVFRSDYYRRQGNPPGQIEVNTVAAGFFTLAGRVNRLHRYLMAGTPLGHQLVENDPLVGVAEGFARAFRAYGREDGVVLMVVQPQEKNRTDQRGLEFALGAQGIPCVRMTLQEIAQAGILREGHLMVHNRLAAVTYFRAGYAPLEYQTPEAYRAREMIEQSSTIAVPDAATQLAGMKKVQQVLARPGELARYLPPEEASRLAASFVAMHGAQDTVSGEAGPQEAWELAVKKPGAWVAKPPREGGGNNLFDEDMVKFLKTASPQQRAGWVLMERMVPPHHQAWLVRNGEVRQAASHTEVGRFGVLLAEDQRVLWETDAGYLARTSPREAKESGVSAGFGVLDSLYLEKS
ncbi:MAG: glutathione synthetase [Deltaproteobacteria bacterium]|nr:glutathione synthetase [Deltaproteobacteria bacterium]